MKSVTQKWIERATYDLQTARGMIVIRKYLYAAFMCQQALEKLLKGLLSSQDKQPYPIHNLLKLATDAGVLEECEKYAPRLLADLNPYCVKARYGDYKHKLSELCDRKTAISLVERTEGMFKWLQKKIGN